MKNKTHGFTLMLALLLLVISGCSKTIETSTETNKNLATSFTAYTIQQGNHSSDQSALRSVETSEMKFAVVFDNSAMYASVDPNNQFDINKLYGFSEGLDNQYNSARIGWNWYDNSLHLHAYIYNNGARLSSEIKIIAIGEEVQCSIKVSGSNYIFIVDDAQVTLPRGLSTSNAKGYQQFPYFGGDEVAPHKITIKIKDL